MSESNEWDPDAYDDHAFVHEYGGSLVDLLDPEPDERVLDVGCGTGELTAEIADRAGTTVGVDSSESMIAEARERHAAPTFRCADARTVSADEPFDAVFSNAAFHWIDDQDALLTALREALAPGGRLVAEFGGKGNVGAVTGALQSALAARGHDAAHPWYFPSVGEYAPLLAEHGFEVRLARLFDRPTELDGGEDGLRNLYEMFYDPLLGDLDEETRAGVVAEAEDALRDNHFEDGTWTADYRRLRVVAVRV